MTAAESEKVSGGETHVFRRLSVLVTCPVQPVGKLFQANWRRHYQSLPDTTSFCSEESEDSGDEKKEIQFEDNITYLRSLDPAEWKNQDHYAVLGLKHLRYKATDNDIRRAYRYKVLRHHPDKRKGAGEEMRPDDDYFTCITRAYETLGNPTKRRSYDSVDPEFEDSVPSVSAESKANFFEVFGPFFELNARWSNETPVPKLGQDEATRGHVEEFYSFWYDFDSWREFSYLDEEEKEKGQAREERRWIEKQNRVARAKRKKEETARIRKLVDNAYNCDPRIQRFKEEEKEKKMAQKRARQEAIKAKQEEESRQRREAQEAERRQREQAEQEEKAKQDALRKEREAAKRALKKEQKALRTLCSDKKYYSEGESDRANHMVELEKICRLLNVEQLEELRRKLSESDWAGGRAAFLERVREVNLKLEEEKRELLERASKKSDGSRDTGQGRGWTSEELQLLIKAVNLFPAGTNQRWEVVANFINQHHEGEGSKRTAKEVLARAKDMQNSDFAHSSLKEEANRKAFDHFERNQKGAVRLDNTEVSQRFDAPSDQQGKGAWTSAEQRMLEQALRTYPASTSDRWDKIASCVPSRNKKECMQRYKELAEMVKAKKAAQAAAAKK